MGSLETIQLGQSPYIPDEETADELSEWSKVNNYPAFINCMVGWYVWNDDDGTFYKED